MGYPGFEAAAAEIVALSRSFHARGWALATSGNFSSRIGEGAMAITMSGRHKGDLTAADVMIVDMTGRALDPPSARPSAETLLHCRLYRRDPRARTVVHIHSPHATVLSRLAAVDREILLEGYEMLKAFAGVATHEHVERVPIFANSQDIAQLAREVEAYVEEHPSLHGYLIAGHGLYTWGEGASEARRHAEAFEFLFECELLRRGAR
jgi:methylthioribulose-1-phosphate dehydratase